MIFIEWASTFWGTFFGWMGISILGMVIYQKYNKIAGGEKDE